MSAITDEITAIESYLSECFASYALINPKKVERLVHLKTERVRELASTHKDRMDVMMQRTRELTSKIPAISQDIMKLNPQAIEKLHEEQEKYDEAAKRWVISESVAWEESEAFTISAGILILANEIC